MTESALVSAEPRGPQQVDGGAPAPADGGADDSDGTHKIGMFEFFLRVVQSTGNTIRFLVIILVLIAALVAAIGVTAKIGGIEVGPVKIGHIGAVTGSAILVVQLLSFARKQFERMRSRTLVSQQRHSRELHLVRS